MRRSFARESFLRAGKKCGNSRNKGESFFSPLWYCRGRSDFLMDPEYDFEILGLFPPGSPGDVYEKFLFMGGI